MAVASMSRRSPGFSRSSRSCCRGRAQSNSAHPFYRLTSVKFAAVHESGYGTFRTQRDVRLESVMRFKADTGESNVGVFKEVENKSTPSTGDGVEGRLTFACRSFTKSSGFSVLWGAPYATLALKVHFCTFLAERNPDFCLMFWLGSRGSKGVGRTACYLGC